ncbi:MAG: hypothetical protein AAF583_15620, partial [Pseudomonadota bacterium]
CMRTVNHLMAARTALNQLEAQGIQVEECQDMEAVPDLLARAGQEAGKAYLTPLLSPEHNDLTPENCVWLYMKSSSGVSGIIGARVHESRQENIGRYWQRHYSRVYDLDPAFSKIEYGMVEFLRGRLVYLGDLHISINERSRPRIMSSFTTVALLVVALKWQPDFVYAFLHNNQIRKGAASEYGFATHLKSVRQWTVCPHKRAQDEWLAVSSANQIDHIASSLASVDQAAMSKDRLPSVAVAAGE